jgi:hypothetical protein
MFIGHFAVGFAAKRLAPRASLSALMAAPILLDLLWPIFLLLGLEQVRIDPGNTAFTPLDFSYYPLSHSFVLTLGWATGFALFYQSYTRYLAGAVLIWIGVVSHWIFDLIVHRPDLPIYPGGVTHVGLGLWNSVPATIAVEGTLFIIGLWSYSKGTYPKDKVGIYGYWSFVLFLILLYVGNLFGPPPPDVTTLAIVALGVWFFLPWVWWFDRHRPWRNS